MVSPTRFIALACVLLISLLSVGVVHGLWTDRWRSSSPSQEVLEAEISKVPLSLGTWEGKAQEVSAHPLMPDATNYALRRYVNRTDGTVLTMMLTRGRPGPMVVKHLPTECYPSNGFELVDGPNQLFSEGSGKAVDEFSVATFKKGTDVVPTVVRVYWSWTGDGQWQTPSKPRMTFAPYSVLYKLYVVRPLLSETGEAKDPPVEEFIKHLTTAMRETFFVDGR